MSAFVGQKLLSFIYFTIVARHVGVQGSGRYFLAVSFTTIFSVFIDLGLSSVLVREVAKRPERARELLANALGIKALLAAVTVAAALVTAHLLDYPAETLTMISIACIVMTLDATHLALYAVMRGLQNLRYEAMGVVSGQLVTIIAGIYFVLSGFPLPFLVVALVCGSTWNVIWASSMLARRFKIYPFVSFNLPVVKFFVGITLPFALAGIFSRIYSYIDSIMLSKMIGDAAVGLYSVGYKLTFAFQFIPMAFSAAIYPAMSEYYVTNRARLASVFALAETYLMLVAIPLAVGIATLAPQIVGLVYGPAFRDSVPPLRILLASLVFAFLYWPAGSMLNACDRAARNTAVMGITMGINVVSNIILIPRYGAVGAAISALIGNFALFASAYWFAAAITPIRTPQMLGKAGRILGCAAIMSLIIFACESRVHPVILVPVGILVYLAALVGTRTMTAAEIKQLMMIFLRRGRGVSDIAV